MTRDVPPGWATQIQPRPESGHGTRRDRARRGPENEAGPGTLVRGAVGVTVVDGELAEPASLRGARVRIRDLHEVARDG